MVLETCFLHTDPRNHEKNSLGVRGKAGFTHESGDFAPDVSGKRFSAHGVGERRPLAREEGARKRRKASSRRKGMSLWRENKKNRPGTAPDLLSSGYRGETSCPAFLRYRYKFHSAGH